LKRRENYHAHGFEVKGVFAPGGWYGLNPLPKAVTYLANQVITFPG